VPSYTSNSKYRSKVIIFFLIVLFFFLLSNFLIRHHFYGHVTKNNYINNMPSKEKHMALNLKSGPRKDVVFIGNSRTLFQVSTLIMKKYGLNVYNLGVSGHETESFPSMVAHTLPYRPKSIALCLAAGFFHGKLPVPRDVDLDDLKAYIKTHQKLNYILKALWQYFRSWFLVNVYATNINLRIRTAYQAFNVEKFSIKRLRKGVDNPMFHRDTQFQFDRKLVKCRILRVAYPKRLEVLGMCTNGDGLLVGNNPGQLATYDDIVKNNPHNGINAGQLRLFNYIVDTIRQRGIKPIVIFTPVYRNVNSKAFLQKVTAAIHAPVIDLSNIKLTDSMWADIGHLNIKGRYLYSHILAKRLRHVMLKIR